MDQKFSSNLENNQENHSKIQNLQDPNFKSSILTSPIIQTTSQPFINRLIYGDSRNMTVIPNNSVALMVTSPPYNVTKQYDDNLSLAQYLDLLENVFKEVYRVLKPSGVAAINIANVGRQPYIPLESYVIIRLQNVGFKIFQEIIWNKEASAGSSCAWGSWQSASNPTLRDVHEYIILATKSESLEEIPLLRVNQEEIPQKAETRPIKVPIPELYSNLWSFQAESAKKVNHPAPFRVELPLRLILLFSNPQDLILDPFIGSGSTAIAAIITDRLYVGYDINQDYLQQAETRILSLYETKNNKPKEKIRKKGTNKSKKTSNNETFIHQCNQINQNERFSIQNMNLNGKLLNSSPKENTPKIKRSKQISLDQLKDMNH